MVVAIFLWSTPVLLSFKVSHEVMLKRKNLTKLVTIKTCRPYFFQMTCRSTITFSYNCFMQRIKVFLSANEPMLHRLVSHCFNSLLTFSVMESRVKWAYLELQKVKMSEAHKSKKNPLFSYINSGKLETTVTPRLHYTGLDFTMLPFLTHLTYLWLFPSLGFSSVL